jgi:hypothetical protein
VRQNIAIDKLDIELRKERIKKVATARTQEQDTVFTG